MSTPSKAFRNRIAGRTHRTRQIPANCHTGCLTHQHLCLVSVRTGERSVPSPVGDGTEEHIAIVGPTSGLQKDRQDCVGLSSVEDVALPPSIISTSITSGKGLSDPKTTRVSYHRLRPRSEYRKLTVNE